MRLSPCVLVQPDGWARGEREGYGEPCDETSHSLTKETRDVSAHYSERHRHAVHVHVRRERPPLHSTVEERVDVVRMQRRVARVLRIS